MKNFKIFDFGTYVFWEFIFTLFITFFAVIVKEITSNMSKWETMLFWVHELLLEFGSFTLNIVLQEFPDLIFDSSSLFVISKWASVFCLVSGKVLKYDHYSSNSAHIIIWNSEIEKTRIYVKRYLLVDIYSNTCDSMVLESILNLFRIHGQEDIWPMPRQHRLSFRIF